MQITAATSSDVEQAVSCLTASFAEDPLTGFLFQAGPNYREHVTQFFSLLMGARIALDMPVFVARGTASIHGTVMGYSTARPKWPREFAEGWDRFEQSIPGLSDRMALYDEIAAKSRPRVPHYYLGVLGTDPALHGRGIGTQLIKTFCDLSASDPLSEGVFLETANPSNVRFYEHAGFAVTGEGSLGSTPLWCMFLRSSP